MSSMNKINIEEKFALFSEHWRQKSSANSTGRK